MNFPFLHMSKKFWSSPKIIELDPKLIFELIEGQGVSLLFLPTEKKQTFLTENEFNFFNIISTI